MAKKHDLGDSKIYAFLGIFLTIIGYIIVHFTRKDDKYAMHYAKQGLVLFIAFIVSAVASWVLEWIPVVGRITGIVLWAVTIGLWIVGIVYSLSGEEKEIPVIGELAKKI